MRISVDKMENEKQLFWMEKAGLLFYWKECWLKPALTTSMKKQNLCCFILPIQIFSNSAHLLMILIQVIEKCANPWTIFPLEQQKNLHPFQLVHCGVTNLSPNLKTIIRCSSWRMFLYGLFMVSCWMNFPNREESAFIDGFLDALLINKYLVLIHKNVSYSKASKWFVCVARLSPVFGWHAWKSENTSCFQPLQQSYILKIAPYNLEL